jgi:hypothetical protein
MHLRIAAVWIVLCAATACGGGGVPEIPPDTVPPTLDVSQPADGESQVLVGTPIHFTFSEDIKHAAQVSVQVNGGAAVAVTPQYSEAGNKTTVTIDPPVLSSLPATVAVTFTNVLDLSGNPMAAPLVVEWTYPDWLPMGLQLTATANNLLAAGPVGPVTAWLEGGAVKVRAWNGASWDAPADPVTSGAASLSLITNSAGAPVVAYVGGLSFHAQAYGTTGWAEVGTNALPTLSASEYNVGTGLTVDQGSLHVAVGALGGSGWVNLYRLQGGSWSERGASYHITSGQSITGISGYGAGVVLGLASTPMPWMPDWATGWQNINNPGGSVAAVGAVGGSPLSVVGGVVKRWDLGASSWSNLGTTSNVVTLDTRGKAPVITTRTGSGTSATATVLEWDSGSSSWVALGANVTSTATQGIVATEDAAGTVYRSANGIVSRYNRPPGG